MGRVIGFHLNGLLEISLYLQLEIVQIAPKQQKISRRQGFLTSFKNFESIDSHNVSDGDIAESFENKVPELEINRNRSRTLGEL